MNIAFVISFVVSSIIIRSLMQRNANIMEKVAKPFKIRNFLLFCILMGVIICAFEITVGFNETIIENLILALVASLLWNSIIGIQ